MRTAEYKAAGGKGVKGLRRNVLKVMTACMLTATALAGCSPRDGMPSSTGQPYEALIVAPDTLTAATVMRILDAPMPGLPQEEPLFDITYCDNDKYGYAQRMTRSVVIIDIDSSRHRKVEIRYERDKHASPQIIVYLNSPSKDAINVAMTKGTGGAKLKALLMNHEKAIQARFIDEHRNDKMEKTARRMFGIDIHIPANMQASKAEKGFLWIADNSGSTMQGLCIFNGTQTDSILKKHIKGEKDSMYMVLKDGKERGLWEMKGDAMGGPYIMRTIHQPSTITLLGFVYAPGHDKRNMIRRLESIISSATPADTTYNK